MNLAQLLRASLRSIARNRLRSFLTSLGIIIGVGSVIIMMAVGAGAQRAIENRIASMGANLLQIQRAMTRGGPGSNQARAAYLTRADAAKLAAEASFAAAVSGVTQRSYTVSGGGASLSVPVYGVEPGYLGVRDWAVAEGAAFDDDDLRERNRVALIGTSAAAALFGDGGDPLGQRVRIGDDNFTIIGVLETKGASGGGADQDNALLVPLDTALTRLSNSRNLSSIVMSVVDKRYMAAAQREAELILREAHGLADAAPADFTIMNSADLIDMAASTTASLTILLAAIAGVSLLVGGIGIMNIMLVSVTERTREIGIRMSVGARRRDILWQFLTEAVLLALLGGLAGVALAALACRALALWSVPTAINPAVVAGAAAFASLVGIVFGFAPARKAAGLYPIDALRCE